MRNKIEIFTNLYRKQITVAIMLVSIAGLFIIGVQYDLFGMKINFIENPATYLFFGFILLGIFGIFYSFLKATIASIVTIFIACLFFLIFIAGKLSRGEF